MLLAGHRLSLPETMTVQSCDKPKSQLFGTTTVQGNAKEKKLREKKKPAKSPGCDVRSDDRMTGFRLVVTVGDHGR